MQPDLGRLALDQPDDRDSPRSLPQCHGEEHAEGQADAQSRHAVDRQGPRPARLRAGLSARNRFPTLHRMVQESFRSQRYLAAQGDLTALLRDDFLAEIVGRPSFRLALPSRGCDEPVVRAIRAAQRKPVFLYAKLPTDAIATVGQLEELGFHVIDTSVTLERPVAGQPIDLGATRPARPGDRDAAVAPAAGGVAPSRRPLRPGVPPAV